MAGKLDLIINQGETFTHTLKWSDSTNTPFNLTGYSAKMQIRESAAASTPYIELTNLNGGIIFSATPGTFSINISAAATALFTWTSAVYDLLLTDPAGVVTRLIEGRVSVSKGITR